MVINHNMSAIYANRQLGITGLNISKDMEKLSSGERINRAAMMLPVLQYLKRCAHKYADFIRLRKTLQTA